MPKVKLHDFHLANQIVKIAREHARQNNLSQIKKIMIELGNVIEHDEAIQPDNLAYNINLLMPCKVEIKSIQGDSWKLTGIEGE